MGRLLNDDRKLLHFSVMRGSVAELVKSHVAALPGRSFVESRDIDGPRGAIDTALSRLAARGDLLRVRNGLYWKGTGTPMGMSRPRTEEVALKIGGLGSGPAGAAAAHWLGLSSQVPATFLVAVPTRVPRPWRHVQFTQRPVERLLRALTPTEVAVIEVLREGPAAIEASWDQFGKVVVRLAEQGKLRNVILSAEVDVEPHRAARARWAELRATDPSLEAVA